MNSDRLRELIEAIPSHDIGGYEWECYSCHSHYFGPNDGDVQVCRECGHVIDPPKESKTWPQFTGHFFEDGTPTHCDDLVSRADVLKALGVEPTPTEVVEVVIGTIQLARSNKGAQ